MTMPNVETYADLALARAAGERGHRRRVALLLWWPAAALVIVLAEVVHLDGKLALVTLGVLWGLLLAYAFWARR
jgi:hypothetical protein